ncbi:MAG TPA: exo-alpha-sialidase [Chryseolinea sp.]
MKWFILFSISIVTLVGCQKQASNDQRFRSAIIFPYQEEHVHGSTVVNLPNGDMLSAWFQGSGERWADDVRIMGSRLIKGDTAWSLPFVLADVNGFPDINPVLFMDKKERLWLMWYPVLANQWETSIPMYRISENYNAPGAPVWSLQEVLFVKVGDKTERGIQENDLFVKEVRDQLKSYEEYFTASLLPSYTDSMKNALLKEWERYKVKMDSLSKGENMIRSGRAKTDNNKETSAPLGYPLTRRLGWQTKNKAIFLGDRMIVPLYSDGFDCSLFAISDDGGQNWSYSNPVLGGAGIQATIAIGKDSLLVAYLRDNGPPPSRMQRTESRDKGLTWTIAKDDILPNPGAGFDVVTLSSGEWVMVFNDSEEGRHNLSVAVSDDDGKTWKWKKSIENDTTEKPTSSHYPAIIADSQDRIHITYSYHRNDIKPGRTIKYVSFPMSYLKNE